MCVPRRLMLSFGVSLLLLGVSVEDARADLLVPGPDGTWESPPARYPPNLDEPLPPGEEAELPLEEESKKGCAGNLFGFIALAAGVSLLTIARRQSFTGELGQPEAPAIS